MMAGPGVVPDAVGVQDPRPNRFGFDHDEDIAFWQAIPPASQIRNEQDTKTFTNFKNHVENQFPCSQHLTSRELEKILKLEKRCFQVDREDDPVHLRSFRRMTKFFGPYKRTDQSCIHLEQVKKLVSYTIRQHNTRVSPFAGWMTQDDAKDILLDKKPETYLIRFSEEYSDKGGFSLAVKANNLDVRHYRILGKPENAVQGTSYNARLKLVHGIYREMNDDEPEFTDIVSFMNGRLDDEIEDCVSCTDVCPGLPFNALVRGYD